MKHTVSSVLLCASLAACGGGDSPSSPSTPVPSAGGGACSTLGQINFVRDTLQEWYLWYDKLPDPDPSGFSSPEAYLESVRYRPLDSSFSFIADKAEIEAYYANSELIGIGVSWGWSGAGDLRVSQVYEGSPADEVGLRRGDYVLEINGYSLAQLRSGTVADPFGPDEVGVPVSLAWRTPEGEARGATMLKRVYTIPPVTAKHCGKEPDDVGYIFLRNFVEPAIPALDAVFEEYSTVNSPRDIVLDLRYNGGGLVEVARHLASLITGQLHNGRVFAEFRHNDKNADRNEVLLLEEKPRSRSHRRLVVITTPASASASEVMINNLRPYLYLTVVGSRTYGKPVGQYGFDLCDKVLFPVAFETANADGEADYFDGIPADCPVEDDLDHQIGDPEEASLREALHFVDRGTCRWARSEGEVESLERAEAVLPHPYGTDPWRQLRGAF